MDGIRTNNDGNEGMDKNFSYFFMKRLIDLILSILGIVFLSPIMLIIAIAIKVESKGPIIFSQDRVGKDGKFFKMYKFRSMVINAEELKENF